MDILLANVQVHMGKHESEIYAGLTLWKTCSLISQIIIYPRLAMTIKHYPQAAGCVECVSLFLALGEWRGFKS